MTTWNRRLQRHHRRRNLVQSLTLLIGMVALLSLVGWTIAGTEGILWAAMTGGLSLALAPRMSPRLLLRLYRGARLSDRDVPDLYRALAAISRRAGLPAVPALHYIPSAAMNAFAVGRPGTPPSPSRTECCDGCRSASWWLSWRMRSVTYGTTICG